MPPVTDPAILSQLNGGAPAAMPAQPRAPGVIQGAPVQAPPPEAYKPPAGYTGSPESLAPIPGGPADPTRPGGELSPAAQQPAAPDPGRASQITSIIDTLDRLSKITRNGSGIGSIEGQEAYRTGDSLGGLSSFFNQDANTVAGLIEQVQGDLTQQILAQLVRDNGGSGASGMANTEAEARRMAAAIAPLSTTMNDAEFAEGLRKARAYYERNLSQIQSPISTDNGVASVRVNVPRDEVAGGGTPPRPTGGDGGPGGGNANAPTNQDIYADGIQWGSGEERGFDRNAVLADKYGIEAGGEDLIRGFARANSGNRALTAEDVRRFYQANNLPQPSDADLATFVQDMQTSAIGTNWGGINTIDDEARFNAGADQVIAQRGINPESGGTALGRGAAQGVQFNLGDELAGVLEGVSNPGNFIQEYQTERDVQRRIDDRASEASPWLYLGGQLGGGLVSGGALARGPVTVGNAVRTGAIEGAAMGFGSGEGAQNSLLMTGVGAGGGATLSGGIAYAGQRGVNALSSMRSSMAPRSFGGNRVFNRAPGVNTPIRDGGHASEAGFAYRTMSREEYADAATQGSFVPKANNPRYKGEKQWIDGASGTNFNTNGDNVLVRIPLNRVNENAPVRFSDAEVVMGTPFRRGIATKARDAIVRRGTERNTASANARALSEAGQAEGVAVNRAMVNPQSNNAITRADASIAGGSTIQREMNAIEGQVEGSVKTSLGRGGRVLDDVALGDRVAGAGERFIKQSGARARRQYDEAEQLADDARVDPTQSRQHTSEVIARLSETPETNKAEIAFLRTIESDLGRDLSVGALRRMRTQLRKRISRGELTFGEDEATVLRIMDLAADDIRTGLAAQGRTGAAQAFDRADAAYRERMDYIQSTLQKVMGKRNANRSAEQVANQVRSMSRNDERGLRQLYDGLEPDEALDVSATFANELGRDRKGGFSIPLFLNHTEAMSEGTLRTLFGQEGAQSITNLRLLGGEVNRVTSAMNSRKSVSGVAVNAREWLFSLLGGSGVGAVAGGTPGALVVGGAVLGAKAGSDLLSARLLMSPNIVKWLRQAPATAEPRAINAYVGRLRSIASRTPALATDIEALERALMSAVNDNGAMVPSAAAGPQEGQQNDNGQPPAR